MRDNVLVAATKIECAQHSLHLTGVTDLPSKTDPKEKLELKQKGGRQDAKETM